MQGDGERPQEIASFFPVPQLRWLEERKEDRRVEGEVVRCFHLE